MRFIFVHLFQNPLTARCLIIGAVAFLATQLAHAQQDCNTAVHVCGNDFVQNTVAPGYGTVQELNYPYNTSCLAGGEQNSTWYVFTVNNGGLLGFNIVPNSAYDDYDWGIFDITNAGCSGIQNGTAPEVACNYSVFPGNTGMSSNGNGISAGPLDTTYCAPVQMQTNHTYAMVVNNSSLTTNGYALHFNGTANIVDNMPPQPSTIAHYDCDQRDTLLLTLSEMVQCNSIAADGSDFSFGGPAVGFVYGAVGVGCNASSSTNQIQLALNAPIEANGVYTLLVNTGSDGNTLLDNCGNATPAGTTIQYTVTNLPEVDLGMDTALCDGDAMTLDAGNPGTNYYWSTGERSQTINVHTVPTTIWVQVNRNGCYATDSIRIASACSVYVPNAFSPNDDGINDVFNFISPRAQTSELFVYNRWGVRVFYSGNKDTGWDGSDGWDLRYPSGMYVYAVRGTFRNGKSFSKSGTLMLMR